MLRISAWVESSDNTSKQYYNAWYHLSCVWYSWIQHVSMPSDNDVRDVFLRSWNLNLHHARHGKSKEPILLVEYSMSVFDDLGHYNDDAAIHGHPARNHRGSDYFRTQEFIRLSSDEKILGNLSAVDYTIDMRTEGLKKSVNGVGRAAKVYLVFGWKMALPRYQQVSAGWLGRLRCRS